MVYSQHIFHNKKLINVKAGYLTLDETFEEVIKKLENECFNKKSVKNTYEIEFSYLLTNKPAVTKVLDHEGFTELSVAEDYEVLLQSIRAKAGGGKKALENLHFRALVTVSSAVREAQVVANDNEVEIISIEPLPRKTVRYRLKDVFS